MSRYTEEELAHLKSSVDLTALIRSKGIELKSHGSKDMVAKCPFHKDDTASLVVTPEKNLFHCMGCGIGGSVIDFLIKHDGIGFRHAVEVLREDKVHAFVREGHVKSQRLTKPVLDLPIDKDSQGQGLMTQVLAYYHERLKQDKLALGYLIKRGLGESDLIEHFKIGYADRSLGLRIPLKNRVDGKLLRERLLELGLYRRSGHEHFNGCLVFPIKDADGKVTEIYGRKTVEKQKNGIYHLYLPGPHVGIFNRECLGSSEIILCESVIDALTFWVNGFKNVSCIYGTEGFSDELYQALKEHKIEKVNLAYDRDESGERAAQRDAKKLMSIGIECFRIEFPQGMDANEYACKVSPANRSLAALVRGAKWLGSSTNISSTSTLAANMLVANNTEDAAKGKKGEKAVSTTSDLVVEHQDEDCHIVIGERQYRIRGLHKNTTLEVLKVNLRVLCNDLFHLDMLDFYSAKQRRHFEEQAASELNLKAELIRRDLSKLLLRLEQLQEERFRSKELSQVPLEQGYKMSEHERESALELLKEPRLLERILEDFDSCGIVGESTNKLTGYLAVVSRKLTRPLAVIIQSTSAAGKSTLMESVLSFLPEEEQVKFSAMTGQSLYYLGETDLKHKVLAIVEEEGAEKASYALKLLQSEGELTIASTGKNATSGRMETHEYHLEGPVMLFLTTTDPDVDEELVNRCLLLSVDEGGQQTGAVHNQQRQGQTLESLENESQRQNLLQVHRNAQRLLKPINVVNPYAPYLSFRSDRTRFRRDHVKYLNLINTIALLHQYQRPLHKQGSYEYIEASLEDIALANRITQEVIGRSLDELSPQGRNLLNRIVKMVNEKCDGQSLSRQDCYFTRRDVRVYSGWSEYQVRMHMQKLCDLEYLCAHNGRQGRSFVYELLCDGKDEHPANKMGLTDIESLKLVKLRRSSSI